MKVQRISEGDVLTLRPEVNKLDALNADVFREHLVDAIDKGHRTLVIDLASVEFMDSSGLGALVSAMKHLGSRGQIHLAGVRSSVQALLKLTQMVRIFPIFDSVESALAARFGRVE